MNEAPNKLIELVTSQAISAITKTTPLGHIPILNTALVSLVSGTINIILNKTILSGYVKQIEEDILKNSEAAKEARLKLEDPTLTPEERIKHEEHLKGALRNLFDFRN